MHVDPQGVMHPDSGDPVTIDGLAHIAGCEVCKVVRPWLHVSYEAPQPRTREPLRIKFEPDLSHYDRSMAELNYYYGVLRPYEPLVRIAREAEDPRPRVFAETYRRSFRCWLGLHRWQSQPQSIYERCIRCGKRERAF